MRHSAALPQPRKAPKEQPEVVSDRLAADWFVEPGDADRSLFSDPLDLDPVDLRPVDYEERSAGTVSPLSLLLSGDVNGGMHWQVDALCAQTDPEAFFPEKGGSTREAKRVCGACNVRAECLEYALGNDERFGIWGGMSERERRKLKKKDA